MMLLNQKHFWKHFWGAGLLLAGLIAAPAAHAQLSFTLLPGNQSGIGGDTLHFTGALSNPSTTDTINLNSDSATFTAPGLTLDDSPFFNNAPSALSPMGSVDGSGNPTDSYTGGFFDITIASDGSALPGTYSGVLNILGGPNAGDLSIVASQKFTVTVQSAPIPEASSLVSLSLLLALGTGGLIVAGRHKKRA